MDTVAQAQNDAEGRNLFGAVPSEVSIYEVGPRDGLQNEKVVLPTDRKLEMIEGAVDAGIGRVEITSFVNPRWIPALADHMEVAAKVKRKPNVAYSALVPNMRGLDGATRSGMEEVAVFMAASETHNRKNINKSTAEALADLPGRRPRGARPAASRCAATSAACTAAPMRAAVPLSKTCIEVARRAASSIGVYELSLGDTIGVGTPRQVEYILLGAVRSRASGLDQLAVHFHDTRGTALANIVGRPPVRRAVRSTARSGVWAAAHTRRGRPATSPPRTSSTCCRGWG